MAQVKLMIPGPVDVTEDVRKAMAVPATPHYGSDWVQFLRETREMAQKVFQTRHDLYIMAGPGTMALEASMASALEPGDAVLMPCNGFFAERLVTVARGQGLAPVVIEAPAGEPILPAAVDAALQTHPDVKAVVLVHHETATCVLNPLEAIAEVVRAHDKLFIVDAVSSIGGVPVLVDDWGIDFCVSVANKALETPPGLALVSISPQGWEASDARRAPRGWYMDLKTWRWYAENWGDWHPTPVTMPVSNVYALHRSLRSMMEQGLEQRYAAYQAAARAVRRGLEALGFPLLVKDDAYASPLTTAFYMRPGVNPAALQTALMEEAKVQVSVGIGALHDDILRVGHLGLARKRDYVVAFLLGVEDYLRSQEIPVPMGQSLAALEGLEV